MDGERDEKADALGDPADWVRLHGPALFAYARLRLRDADAAEDAVQEALLAALRGRAGFDGRSSPRTWLLGILRHKILDALRASGRAAVSLEGADSDVLEHGHSAARPRPWPAAVDDGRETALLRDAIGRLPDTMRLALVLREVDGLPGATVCEVLGVSPTNLWTLVHRAKLRLREELGESLDPGRSP